MSLRIGQESRCCCCGAKQGTYVAGAFTLVTSIIQVAGQLAIYAIFNLWDILKYDAGLDDENREKLTAVYHQLPRAYMALGAFDILLIIISLLLLLGNHKGLACLLQGWLVCLVSYIVYEITVNVIFFSGVFREISELVHPQCVNDCDWLASYGVKLSVPLLCYWLLKLVFNLSGIYVVWHRVKDIKRNSYIDIPFHSEWERVDFV